MLLDLPQPPWTASSAWGLLRARFSFLARSLLGSRARQLARGCVVWLLGTRCSGGFGRPDRSVSQTRAAPLAIPAKPTQLPPSPKATQYPGRVREVKEEPRSPFPQGEQRFNRGGGHGRSRPGYCAAARRQLVRVFEFRVSLWYSSPSTPNSCDDDAAQRVGPRLASRWAIQIVEAQITVPPIRVDWLGESENTIQPISADHTRSRNLTDCVAEISAIL